MDPESDSKPFSRGMRRLLSAVALLCVAAGLWLLFPVGLHWAAQAILASKQLTTSRNAPEFALQDTRGTKVRLSDFKGKVVVLNFWATWCGPCKTEIPWFIDFQNKFAAQGFSVVGVSMDQDGWQVVRPFVAAQKMNYPVVLGDEETNQKYGGIEALPTTLVLGRDGSVKFIHAGLISRAEYEREIEQLLKG